MYERFAFPERFSLFAFDHRRDGDLRTLTSIGKLSEWCASELRESIRIRRKTECSGGKIEESVRGRVSGGVFHHLQMSIVQLI